MLQVKIQRRRSVTGGKWACVFWKGVCSNIYFCFARLCTLWLISRKFWRVCHLKCVTNPESDSGAGGRLTCSQNAHFMGEVLLGSQALLPSSALNVSLNPGALFHLTFPFYSLFYFPLISQDSSHSLLKTGMIVPWYEPWGAENTSTQKAARGCW